MNIQSLAVPVGYGLKLIALFENLIVLKPRLLNVVFSYSFDCLEKFGRDVLDLECNFTVLHYPVFIPTIPDSTSHKSIITNTCAGPTFETALCFF